MTKSLKRNYVLALCVPSFLFIYAGQVVQLNMFSSHFQGEKVKLLSPKNSQSTTAASLHSNKDEEALLIWNSSAVDTSSPKRKRKKKSTYAISTMLVATDKNYIQGTKTLLRSVKRHLRVQVDFILVEIKEKPLAPEIKSELTSEGWKIRTVPRIPPNDEARTFPRFRDQFTKLQLWKMTEYNKIIYLDSDCYVVADFSDLFDKGEKNKIVATRDIFDGKWQSTFNMGVFVVKPDLEEYYRLLDLKKTAKFHVGTAEQGFLNSVYKTQWKDPGFEYNANLAAYTQKRSYWKHFEKDIKIIHYTVNKPWNCPTEYMPVCKHWLNDKFSEPTVATFP